MKYDGNANAAVFTALGLEAKFVKKAIRDSGKPGPQVYVVGMGAALASQKIKQAKEQGATAIVALGYCGALDPALRSGHLIIPKSLLQDDDIIEIGTDWQSQITNHLKSDFIIFEQPLVTSSSVVETVEQKAVLLAKTGACAVDMESAILAKEAEKQNLQFLVIRVVHDTATMEIPRAFTDIMDEKGNIKPRKLLQNLIFNWPGMKVLKAQSSASQDAGENLKAVVAAALPDFKLPQ